MKISTEKLQKGFTLVEMLVATAIFTSVMLVATTALLNIINVNKQTQQIKAVVDNVTFALDSISREARIATDYSCNGAQDCPSGGTTFAFLNSNNSTSTYKFATTSLSSGQGNIQYCLGSVSVCNTNGWQSITAPTSTVNITNMVFYVLGATHQNDTTVTTRTQPRVIITLEGNVVEKGGTNVNFTLQTTASERSRISSN